MTKYVTYYRVSTKQQGSSGLGLKAQKDIINNFLGKQDKVLASFTDIESGKKDDRPELTLALEYCQANDATLLVAKLDRLSRDLHFITSIQKAKIKFICAATPNANELTINILGAVAQEERKLISERTKAALKQARKNGVALGSHNPKIAKALREAPKQTGMKHHAVKRAYAHAKEMKKTLEPLLDLGLTYTKIVDILNAHNVPTPSGKGKWYVKSLQRVITRLKEIKEYDL